MQSTLPMRWRQSLPRDVLRDVGRAAEILRRRHLHHRVPVDRRIIVRRRRLVRRRHRREIELLAGLRAHLGRIDQPVAAHPDLVVRSRQVGDDVAPLVVGHDHLGELRRQFGRLRDHPHAGFRPARAAHDAADVVVVDGDRRLLGIGRPENEGQGYTYTRQAAKPMVTAEHNTCLRFMVLSLRSEPAARIGRNCTPITARRQSVQPACRPKSRGEGLWRYALACVIEVCGELVRKPGRSVHV